MRATCRICSLSRRFPEASIGRSERPQSDLMLGIETLSSAASDLPAATYIAWHGLTNPAFRGPVTMGYRYK